MSNKPNHLPRVIVVAGPTASGKTAWGLALAKKFNGEIISADSRQVYRKMNIGTAKPDGQWKKTNEQEEIYHVADIPHHLMDLIDPGKNYSAAEWRQAALATIHAIVKRKHVPIIVGGTGLYISTLVHNWSIPQVEPNKTLRSSLEKKSTPALLRLLSVLDPEATVTIDKKNKRRLIRALEVCIMSGQPFSQQKIKSRPLVEALIIGLDLPRALLHERIEERVESMLKRGLIEEVEHLRRQKYSWKLPSLSGIGYRQFKEYTEGKLTLEGAAEKLKRDTRRFARRQLTWFRRDKDIHWCQNYEEAERLVSSFLKSE